MKLNIAKNIEIIVTAGVLIVTGAVGYGHLQGRVDALESEYERLYAEHHELSLQFDEWRIEASEGKGRLQGAAVEFRDLREDVEDEIQPSVVELKAKWRTFMFPLVKDAIRSGRIQG